MGSIDLTNTFTALQRFSDKLQTIHLGLRRLYTVTWPSRQDITFPQLTQMRLTSCSISDLETVQNIFNALKKPVSQNNVDISLSRYITRSNQDLLNLLKALRKPLRNFKVEFGILVEKLDFDTFGEVFEEFIKETKRTPLVQNVSLSVDIVRPHADRGIEVLAFLKEMFANIKFIAINKRRGEVEGYEVGFEEIDESNEEVEDEFDNNEE